MEFLKGVICLGIFMALADNTLQDLHNTSDATKTEWLFYFSLKIIPSLKSS